MDSGREREAAVRTFLIADIRGYTRFTAQSGDEAASRLATRFAAIAGEGVSAWDGELVELRGDEALAVFSSARQALRAATELQAAFAAATAEEPALPMTVGIGLDAGEAVPVGDGYRGAALNMAARLCSVASAGTVLATTGLVSLAGPVPGLVAGDPEPMTFKGIEGTVDVRHITDATPRPVAPPFPTAGRPPVALPAELEPLVPLIGRAEELRRLRWHWRRAAAGDGRVVIVSGAPGIGKTRLAAELAGEVAAAGLPVHYLPAGRPIPEGIEGAGDGAPTLLVADDVDAAGPAIVELALRLSETAPGSRRLVVLVHRREAPGPLVARLETLAPREQRIVLGPLGADGVRAIVALYAGAAASDAPVGELAVESGGVPASIHRVAGSWARTNATRRLGTSAERAAAERRGLRAAEAVLIADMSDLELATERERLYVGDPTIDPDPDAPVVCPYKGLAEFDATDADFFFGRERLISELVARFVGSSFLALVGDSGSGKSSALRAGLLPALAGGVLPGSEAWPQLVIRPGEHPVAELGRALARLPGAAEAPGSPEAALTGALDRLPPGHRLVIVVDQFEETFNAVRDDAERSAFLDLLTTDRPGLKVIVSMRADHYGRCAAYPALARRMGTDQVLVGPLTSTELAAVIEHPAQRAGLRVEPALTAALVADAGDEPGVLPLLSTALLELWGAREGSRLTLAAYRASGGLHGAIARLAESTWAGLDPHRQAVARSVLLRLAGPGEGAGLVRRRVPLKELDAERDPAVRDVLATLTAARLLTTGDGHVEVAHEALLREWPRLQGWLAEDAAGREVRLHLIGAARDWEASGRDPGDLYRGARLATALEWSAEHALELNESERAFLDAGRRASQQDVERQRRTNRRLRGLLVGTAGLLVLALAAGGLAFVQGQRAEEEAARANAEAGRAATEAERATQEQGRAEAAAAQAETERAAAQAAADRARSRELLASAAATTGRDPELAKLLTVAAASAEQAPTFESTTTLHDVLAADPVAGTYHWQPDLDVLGSDPLGRPVLEPRGLRLWTDLAPDGDRVVAGGWMYTGSDHLESGSLRDGGRDWMFWPARTGAQWPLIAQPQFIGDGSRLVAGTWWDDPERPFEGDGLGVLVLDAATGQVVDTIGVGPCGGVVTGVSGTRVLVWTPAALPNGGCDAGTPELSVVDLATRVRRHVTSEALQNWGGAIGGDGRIVAYEVFVDDGRDLETRVVDVESGEVLRRIRSSEIPLVVGSPGARALSADGRMLAWGNRPVLLFDVSPGSEAPFTRTAGNGGEGLFVTFDPSGGALYTAARDGQLHRFAVPTGAETGVWPTVGDGRASVSPDGRRVLLSDTTRDPVARLLRTDSRAQGDLGQTPTCPAFTVGDSMRTAGGTVAFLQTCDGTPGLSDSAQIVDPVTREIVRTIPQVGIQSIEPSPDGRLLLGQQQYGYAAYGPLALFDVATGEIVRTLEGACDWSEFERTDLACHDLPGTSFAIWAQRVRWSPDGSTIAAVDGGNGGHVAIWDAATGRLLRVIAPPRPEHPDAPTDRVPWIDLVFTPDSRELILSAADTDRLTRIDVATGARLPVPAWSSDAFHIVSPHFLGYDAGGFLVAQGPGSSGAPAVAWLDPVTLDMVAQAEDAHVGSIKSGAFNPDRTLLATGASDGVIRIWDIATRTPLQEIHVSGQVQGLAFLDEHRLLVAPDGGGLATYTTDPAELLRLVRASLARGFSETECRTYRLDRCPTLEELQAGGGSAG